MKRNQLINCLLAAIWCVQLLIEGLVAWGVWQLGMIPTKYFAVLLTALVLVWMIVGLLLFIGRKGSRNGNILRSLACIVLAVTVAGCAAGTALIADLQNTLNHITTPTPTGVTMSIYVLKDDPAQSLADTKEYRFAYVQGYEEERTQQVIAETEKLFGKQPDCVAFDSVEDMVTALYNQQAGAIILNSGYLPVLEENEAFSDFSQKTRVLHEVVTDVIEPTQPTQPTEAPEIPKTVTNTPFILYFSGSDTRYDTLRTSRSDVNILLVVHPVTKQVLLLNTPRDTYVSNSAGNGAKDKLTHCGLYGTNCSAQALEDLYGLQVDYQAQINFTGFETLIDAIGGITVYSDYAFDAGNGTAYVVIGENHFNGKQALAYARERTTAGGDKNRGNNQMKVIAAVIEKMTTSTALITNYSGILGSLQGMFTTDMDMKDIGELVKMQLSDMASWNIQSYAITGTGGMDTNYSMPGKYAYVMYPDMDTVDKASALVNKVLTGGILTPEDVK